MAEMWERQPGESAPAFQAFAVYRDLGPRRTFAEAARKFFGNVKRQGFRQDWPRRFQWSERARAWDDHLDNCQRQAEEQARKDMAQRHAKTALALQSKALERLRALSLEEMGAKDVLSWLETAAKLERLSRGEPEVRETGALVLEQAYAIQKEIRQRILADPAARAAAATLDAALGHGGADTGGAGTIGMGNTLGNASTLDIAQS